MNSNFYDVDVLVVGAGPVGSTLTADLARRGIRVGLIDKAPQSFGGSRAKGIQPRTQEVFDDLGVLADAHAEGGPYPLLGLHLLGPVTVPVRLQRRRKPTSDVPYPNLLLLPQFATDGILHRLVERAGVPIEYGVGLDTFEQDSTGVTATLSSGERVRSRYLVGADGGASTVRSTAGIAFVGTTDDSDKMLIADGTIAGLSRGRWHIWPRTRGTFVAACPLPHSDRFQMMIRLTRNEQPDLDDPAISARFERLTGHALSNITWKSVFRPNVRIVERYRSGRVFLAGDAAHVHTPTGAQGLNTGVQDAYNLGWKLGQVIAGAPDSLLDSYESERRPVAARVLAKSSEIYTELDEGRLSALKRGDEERQLLLSYHDGPLGSRSATTTTLRVGDRAPDAVCAGPGGRRLFDAFRGPHFTVLAFGPGAAQALPALRWPDVGADLRRYAIGGSSGTGRLVDTVGDVARNYGVDRDALVLIRPDGYVGSIVTSGFVEAFGAATVPLVPCARPA